LHGRTEQGRRTLPARAPAIPQDRPRFFGTIKINRALVARKYERLGFKEHRLSLSSGQVCTYLGGTRGETVMLLHGFGFGALETWHHQVGPLSQAHRVVAPDLYWFGRSLPHGHGLDAIRPEDQADALAELIQRLALGHVHLVGISYGGCVALQLVKRHPRLVARLVLVDAAGLEPTLQEEQAIAARFARASDLASILIPPDVSSLRNFLQTVFHQPRYVPGFVLREILHGEFWRHKQVRQAICRQLVDSFLVAEDLRCIAAETLLLWGRFDPILPPSMAYRMADAIPNSVVALFEKSGHAPMLEEPRLFNRILLRFLKRPTAR
jgi:4,5:9,10-diseco-3-hydroxy-5,9,17-trioxoandrosta-1(10),2-diene-4-oate hydrolase